MNIDERIELTKQTLDAMERCRNGVPDGYRLECKSSFSDWGGAPTNPAWGAIGYRLVELPKPKRVPLEECDVIVFKTIMRNKSNEQTGVLSVTDAGVVCAGLCYSEDSCDTNQGAPAAYQFSRLFRLQSAEYSNDGGATWQHCSKVVP